MKLCLIHLLLVSLAVTLGGCAVMPDPYRDTRAAYWSTYVDPQQARVYRYQLLAAMRYTDGQNR